MEDWDWTHLVDALPHTWFVPLETTLLQRAQQMVSNIGVSALAMDMLIALGPCFSVMIEDLAN